MDYLQEMKTCFAEQSEMALATAAEDTPNVRIVTFCTDGENDGVVYFSTFPDNDKVKEFEKNSKVAFTTIPGKGDSRHVRVCEGAVQKSKLTVFDLKDRFVKKSPDYAGMIEAAGAVLAVYEVRFGSARVTLDVRQSGTVTL